MFKFLRKYNTWILAVGGSLLMIVFLIPQAIETLSQRAALGSATWALVDGEKIKSDARVEAAGELEAMSRFQSMNPSPSNTDDPATWFLLVHEAEQHGLVGGKASDMLTPENLQALYSMSERPQLVNEAFGKQLAVNRLMGLYQGAGKLSDARLRQYAQRLFHAVDARIVVLEADPDLAPREPTEAEITAHFDRYKDVEPGTPGEDGMPGYGYRLPNRFHLEWIFVPADSVRTWIESSEIDGVALYKHWQRYQTDRAFPAVDASIDVPDVVREDYLDQRTRDTLDEIAKLVYDQIVTTWRAVPMRDGFRVLPDDWASRQARYEELAAAAQEAYPGLAMPTYQSIENTWLSLDDLADYPELNTVSTEQFGTQYATVPQLIGTLREFNPETAIPMQAGVSSPVMRSAVDGSMLVFRVTDTDAARAPESVDEVRTKIVTDLKRWSHYETLRAQADSLEAEARSTGLLSVAMSRDAEVTPASGISLYMPFILTFQLQQGAPLTRQATSLPVVGPHEPTVEAIVDRALAFPLDKPLQANDVEDRTFVLPVDEKMAVMVVELTKQTPFTRDQYAMVASNMMIQALLLGEELRETEHPLADAYSAESLEQRHNFELLGDDEDETADETATTADASSS